MGQAIDMPDLTRNNRKIIGLTGGIASGKSTVSDYLTSRHGLPVLDADVYSREAVQKGGEILGAIAHRYGPEILNPDGTLDRPKLGTIIFNNNAEKQWIEQHIHPFVRSRFTTNSATFPPTQPLVYAIPLLFEANLTHLVTEIWVVYCTPQQQQTRLMARNQLSASGAQIRIEAQMPLKEKCGLADCTLDNTHGKEMLFEQIDRLLS